MPSLKKVSVEDLLAEIASRLPADVNGHPLESASIYFGPSVAEPYVALHFEPKHGFKPCGGMCLSPSKALKDFNSNASWLLADTLGDKNQTGAAARKFLYLPV